jgi:FKBP-type peptidyl-prolyl cis-trans isomerase
MNKKLLQCTLAAALMGLAVPGQPAESAATESAAGGAASAAPASPSAEAAAAPAATTAPQPAAPPAVTTANVSYFLGYAFGQRIRRSGTTEVDQAQFNAGLADAMSGVAARVSQAEQQAITGELQAREQRLRDLAAANSLAAARAFLEQNAKRPGVQTTASGLQYEELAAGAGDKPSADSRVRVHYRGTLADGQEFDSSIARGEPAEFQLKQVIPGWTEGLQLMSVGSKYKLTIPPELGYGPGGQGPIPPNSVLIFEVELLAIL